MTIRTKEKYNPTKLCQQLLGMNGTIEQDERGYYFFKIKYITEDGIVWHGDYNGARCLFYSKTKESVMKKLKKFGEI